MNTNNHLRASPSASSTFRQSTVMLARKELFAASYPLSHMHTRHMAVYGLFLYLTLALLLAKGLLALEVGQHSSISAGQLFAQPPVDVVYAWVNGTDPTFASRYKHVTGRNLECDRLASSNEIMMALTALCKMQPWVHHVYIVVDQQSFDLDFLHPTCHSKVTFMDVTDFIPGEYLPTFNSLVFEAFLHKIPGLAEHFIYMNDDTIITKPLSISSFFNDEGTFKALMLPHPDVNDDPAHLNKQPWLYPVLNAVTLFKSVFHKDPIGQDAHGAYFLSKKALKASWMFFGRHLSRNLPKNKLRNYAAVADGGDVHITSLSQQVGIQLGLLAVEHTQNHRLHVKPLQYPEWYPSHVLIVPNFQLNEYVSSLFNSEYTFVCLQDMLWLQKPYLQELCLLISQVWCRPLAWHSEHCSRFVDRCSQRVVC